MTAILTDNLGFPFDSVNGDRGMSAGSWRSMLSGLFTNGIFKTDDFGMTLNGMNVLVGTGNAFINGAFFPSEEKTLTIESASGSYNRYDSIVIEFNSSERQVTLKVVKGGSDSKWVTPSRTSSIYQLVIGVVSVKKGVTTLYQNDLSDTRSDSWYCGYVTSTGSQERFEQELASFKNKLNELENLNVWSAWKSCGKNGCGVTLWYRYNDSSKLCEIRWDGSITGTIIANSMGYAWEGFPSDKAPKNNVYIPSPTISSSVVVRFFPKGNDITSGKFTLTSTKDDVSSGYVCGTHIYSYA